MRVPKTLWLIAGLLAGCAHRELTGEEHREAAAADLQVAEQERAKFDPDQKAMEITPKVAPFAESPMPPPNFYNPSEAHLAQADQKMSSAFRHLRAAEQLERFEDVACEGISIAERSSCPVIAPHVYRVEERGQGVVLHLKTAERAKTLAIQMRCHLAFARASNFERVPCPLYMKGVAIGQVGEKAIEVASGDPFVAARVREEARKMFGQAPDKVSMR